MNREKGEEREERSGRETLMKRRNCGKREKLKESKRLIRIKKERKREIKRCIEKRKRETRREKKRN